MAQTLEHGEQRMAVEELLQGVRQESECVERLEQAIREALPEWSLAEVITALQAMRGIDLIAAVAMVAEIGDLSRFQNRRELMGYLGPVPSESSTGAQLETPALQRKIQMLTSQVRRRARAFTSSVLRAKASRPDDDCERLEPVLGRVGSPRAIYMASDAAGFMPARGGVDDVINRASGQLGAGEHGRRISRPSVFLSGASIVHVPACVSPRA